MGRSHGTPEKWSWKWTPPEVVMMEVVPPPEVVMEVDPPGSVMEVEPPRSGHGNGPPRSGHGSGPPPEFVCQSVQLWGVPCDLPIMHWGSSVYKEL